MTDEVEAGGMCFEDGRRSPELRNAKGPKKLEKARKQILP